MIALYPDTIPLRGGWRFERSSVHSFRPLGPNGISAGLLPAQEAVAFAALHGPEALVIPGTLTPTLSRVLGMMIFETAPIAHLFRATGSDIPNKVEAEQAFMLHWLLTLVAAHGDSWGVAAADEADRRRALLRDRQAEAAR